MSQSEFDDAIEAYRRALPAFLHGDPEPILGLYSRRDDVTLANPLGPPARGRVEVERAVRTAAANFKAGTVSFDDVSRYGTPDLGYAVWLEPNDLQLVDTDEKTRISLRVTMVFRREEGAWKIAHRHARPDHHRSIAHRRDRVLAPSWPATPSRPRNIGAKRAADPQRRWWTSAATTVWSWPWSSRTTRAPSSVTPTAVPTMSSPRRCSTRTARPTVARRAR